MTRHVLRALILLAALLLAPIASQTITALPGSLSVTIELSPTDVSVRPYLYSNDYVTIYGNVTFDQPIYQRATVDLSATLDRNWTVHMSSNAFTRRGPGKEPFEIEIYVPSSAKARDVATLEVTAQYSSVLAGSGGASTTGAIRVLSMNAFEVNAHPRPWAAVARGGEASLSINIENYGNEANYFSFTVPYGLWLNRYGILVEAPPRMLLEAGQTGNASIRVLAGQEASPRQYVFVVAVRGEPSDPRSDPPRWEFSNCSVAVTVPGDPSEDDPYGTWSLGDAPDPRPTVDPLFKTLEYRFDPDIDPSGERVVFALRDVETWLGASICLGSTSGVQFSPLTHGPRWDTCPVFSPEGTRIAFVRNDHEVVVIDLNGTELLKCRPDVEWVHLTDWSPKGDVLLLDDSDDVYELDLRANATRPLTGEPVYQWDAVYSPAGDRVYYLSHEAAGPRPEVWSMSPGGADHRQLTFNNLTEDAISISPNGRLVAFAISKEEEYGDRVCVMSSNGDAPRWFADHAYPLEAMRWLPNGSALILEGSRVKGYLVYSDLFRVDYGWTDAVGNGGGDDDGSGGTGDGGKGPLLGPTLWAVIALVTLCAAGGAYGLRRRARSRAAAANMLKEITGKDLPSASAPEVQEAVKEVDVLEVEPDRPSTAGAPPTTAVPRGDYSTGYTTYDTSAPPPEPVPALPHVRRRGG